MAGVQIVLNASALRQVTLALGGKELRVRANRVLSAARALCPVDEGRLRASIAVEYTETATMLTARIGSNLPYALFRHEGTGLYGPRGAYIYPRHAKVMLWPVKNNAGGRRRFKGGSTAQFAAARRTRGTPGVPFLRDALDAAR